MEMYTLFGLGEVSIDDNKLINNINNTEVCGATRSSGTKSTSCVWMALHEPVQ